MSAALNDNVIKGVWARTRRSTVEKGGGGGDNSDMEPRIAILEQIAKDTKDTLKEIKEDLRAMRVEIKDDLQAMRGDIKTETTALRNTQERDFRLTMGVIVTLAIGLGGLMLGLLGLMAKGFHWL